MRLFTPPLVPLQHPVHTHTPHCAEARIACEHTARTSCKQPPLCTTDVTTVRNLFAHHPTAPANVLDPSGSVRTSCESRTCGASGRLCTNPRLLLCCGAGMLECVDRRRQSTDCCDRRPDREPHPRLPARPAARAQAASPPPASACPSLAARLARTTRARGRRSRRARRRRLCRAPSSSRATTTSCACSSTWHGCRSRSQSTR